jgi:hypothetical protein
MKGGKGYWKSLEINERLQKKDKGEMRRGVTEKDKKKE